MSKIFFKGSKSTVLGSQRGIANFKGLKKWEYQKGGGGEFMSLPKPLLTLNIRWHLFDEDALAGQSTPPLQAISEASNSKKFPAWEVCLQTPS